MLSKFAVSCSLAQTEGCRRPEGAQSCMPGLRQRRASVGVVAPLAAHTSLKLKTWCSGLVARPRGGPCRRLKHQCQLPLISAWRDEMRSAEGGEEVVKRHLVGQVDGRKPSAHLMVVCMQDVVQTGADIEQVSRRDAGRIGVSILGPLSGNANPGCAEGRCAAGSDGRGQRGEGVPAQ